MNKKIFLYDTTLRDGTQGENVNFSAVEKIKIARYLDHIGIHYIEGGWPGSNPRDREFFELAKHETFQNAKLTAFSSTRRPDITPSQDHNLQALLAAQTPAVAIFGKTWDLHLGLIKTTPDENLKMICESIAFLKDHDREVIYDAEHFFDGLRANKDYALETLRAAATGGADFIVLCDTNGGTLHFDIETQVKEVCSFLPVKIGIHTHNDSGLATAGSISAVLSGADMVQGTINGYGERCGNADLTTIIPILKAKMNRDCISAEQMTKLRQLSLFVSETANMIPLNERPFVGKSAFAHKGGIHVSAIRKEPRAYEHLAPELTGNIRRVLVSDLSGKSNIEYKAKELGLQLGGKGFNSRNIVSTVKKLEAEGYQYDAAEGSFKILLEKLTGQFQPLFDLESFRVTIEKDKDQVCSAHATIKISVNGQHEITAAEGDGPVSALDKALRKALDKFYPNMNKMHLVDFKVRVIDGRAGTAARVRVLIESRDTDQIWSTIGVSEDIIEASWQALEDSFQYYLAAKTIPRKDLK